MARQKPRVQNRVEPAPAPVSRLRFLAFPAAVAAVAVAVYFPTRSAGWTNTDDIELISEDAPFLASNGAVLSAFRRPFFPSAHERTYYRPLVTASFALDTPRGEKPTPDTYHETNGAVHAVASVLVFFVSRALGSAPPFAAAVAALFAVHPVTAESVAWIPGRCDGLMAVFSLGAMLGWIAFDRSGSRKALAVHLVLLSAALFSKEAAVALPAVCVAYGAAVSEHRARLRNPMPWIGWFVVVAAWFFVRRSVVGPLPDGTTVGTVFRNTPALVVGFGKLVVPVELDVLATLRDSSLVPGIVAAALLGTAAVFVPRDRRHLFVWAAVFFPLAVLAPALAVSDRLILDNRLYLPLAGLVVGLGVFAEAWLARVPAARRPLGVAWGVAAVVLGLTTIRQAHAFESPRDFCDAAVRGSPHLSLAYLNRGGVEYRAGEIDEARRDFERALVENPAEPVAHNNLGLIYLNAGDFARAENEFSLELERNPNYSKAHYNLGLVLTNTGRIELARAEFEKVVALAPADTEAWGELLKYWAPRDADRAATIQQRMESLGVRFFSPE